MGILSSEISAARQLSFVTRLHTAYEGGVPIVRCFALLTETPSRGRAKWIAAAIGDRLARGATLHEALAPEEKYLGRLIVAGLGAGDRTGTLSESLAILERHFKRRMELRRKIIQQMTYPILMNVIACIVIPYISGLYLSKADVATYTMDFVWGLRTSVLYAATWILLLAVMNRVGLTRVAITPPLMLIWPLGGWLKRFALARVFRAMALYTGAGFPLARAVELAAPLANNFLMEHRLKAWVAALREGASLTELVGSARWLPRVFANLIQSGEFSGKLPEVLERCAKYVEDEAAHPVAIIASMTEAILIGVSGVWLALGTLL